MRFQLQFAGCEFIPIVVVFILLTMALGAENSAQDDNRDQTKQTDRYEDIGSIKTMLHEQVATLTEMYRDAKTQQQRDAIIRNRRLAEEDVVELAIQLTRQRDDANRNICDLVWFINRTKGPARVTVFNELMEKNIESEDMMELVHAFGRVNRPIAQNEEWMKTLIEKSPCPSVKANATFVLIEYLEKLQLEIAAELREDRQLSEYLQQRTVKELAAEIEMHLETCVAKYPNEKKGSKKIRELAHRKLAVTKLVVGKIAPDIVGVDLDDVEFKLSDYRGKVVVIDFWADW